MSQAETPAPPRDTGSLSWPVRYPWRTLLIAGVIVAIAVGLIGTMRTDGSLAALLPEHDSSSAALAEIGERFASAEQITLLVTQPPTSQAQQPDTSLVDFAQRFEMALTSSREFDQLFREVAYRWPDDGEAWVREVVTPNLVLYLDEQQQRAFMDRMTPAGMAEQLRRTERAAASPGVAGSSLRPLLDDPLAIRDFVRAVFDDVNAQGVRPGEPMRSANGQALLIRVTPAQPTSDSDNIRAMMDAVRQAVQRAEPGVLDVAITGGPAIAEAAERSIRGDMIASSIGTVVLLQVLFLLTYRRVLMFPIALLPAAGGIVVGFGVFALTGRSLSPPTAVIGALLAGLGIDYAIHYLAHHRGSEPLAQTSRRLVVPIGMACVTSIIAFSAIGLSDVTALRDFATLGVIGLTATFITSLTILPALLTITPGSSRADTSTMRWRVDDVIRAAVAHRRLGLVLCGLAVLAGIGVLTLLPGGPARFDASLNAMHPQPNAPLDTQQRINDAFPGQADALLLLITAESEDELIERAANARQRLNASDAARPYLASVVGIDRFVAPPSARAERHRFADGFDVDQVLADFDAAVEQSIFDPASFTDYRTYLAEVLRPGAGPDLQSLRRYPELSVGLLPVHRSRDGGAGYAAVSLLALTRPLDDRADRDAAIAAIRAVIDGLPGVTLTGMPVVGHDVEQTVRADLSRLLVVAGLAVGLWLLVCFRSATDTAAALIPVVGGLVLLFTAMKVGGVGLNLINLIALPLLAGLGVDDGVFLVAIARDARKRGLDRAGLIRELASSTQAITLTSATTALAFGSLMLTAVPAIRSLGIVMAVGIVACLLLSVFALAPLLVLMHRQHPEPNEQTGPRPDGAAA